MNRNVLSLGPIEANCVILWDDPAAAWIVDPGADAPSILSFLSANHLTPAVIALTHAHFDHIGAIPELLKVWPNLAVHVGPGDVPMLGHPANAWAPYYPPTPKPANLIADLTDGFQLKAGGLTAEILATPGHTPGGVCLYFSSEHVLLTGDTLFAGSCGRTDFPGGDAGRLRTSLARLAALPPETDVIPGHNTETTIGDERAANPFLKNQK